MKVVLAAQAKADIAAIGDRIAEDAPRRAESYVNELLDACASLGSMPLGHSKIPHFEHLDLRRRVFGRYLIVYRVAETIQILRVLHGALDLEEILFPDDN